MEVAEFFATSVLEALRNKGYLGPANQERTGHPNSGLCDYTPKRKELDMKRDFYIMRLFGLWVVSSCVDLFGFSQQPIIRG
jgi:hypothetical protein